LVPDYFLITLFYCRRFRRRFLNRLEAIVMLTLILLLLPIALWAQPQPTLVQLAESSDGGYGYPTISDTSTAELLLQWGWLSDAFPGNSHAYSQRVGADGELNAELILRDTSPLDPNCVPRTTVVRDAARYAARLTAFP
jgi:hypothetical protein